MAEVAANQLRSAVAIKVTSMYSENVDCFFIFSFPSVLGG